jgi:hypothetical protein
MKHRIRASIIILQHERILLVDQGHAYNIKAEDPGCG